MITPLFNLDIYLNNNNFFIKREDLFPFSFGGNKVRIAQEYFKDMDAKKCDCIIGYGNIRSNLCRVIANMAAKRKIECHIISPTDDNHGLTETYNSQMVNCCDAHIHYCMKSQVADTVEKVLENCKSAGFTPYYINGDKYGKGNEAVPLNAYKMVYEEICKQAEEMGLTFDYIFLATGTGMTQAGLLLGKQMKQGPEKIVGISVARSKEQAESVIGGYVEKYVFEAGCNLKFEQDILVEDGYLCGGYGKYDKTIENIIFRMYVENGIPLDPTYTGKAFWGMCEYLKKQDVFGKNILFVHTGGTPLFFDYLRREDNKLKED